MGDIWLCGTHRVLCGDATKSEDVARLLGERKPILMVTDPPYGIELDSEWRDRAGLNGGDSGSKRTRTSKARAAADSQYHAEPSYMKHRTAGHTEKAGMAFLLDLLFAGAPLAPCAPPLGFLVAFGFSLLAFSSSAGAETAATVVVACSSIFSVVIAQSPVR
jgi:hypothetical protein